MGLRIVSWNAAQDWGNRLSLIAGAIRELRADVVAISSPKSQGEVETLGNELGMEAWYGEGNHRWGVGLLTRLPVESFQNHRLGSLFHTLVEARITWEGNSIRVFATHLRGYTPQSPDHRARVDEAHALLDLIRSHASGPVLLCGDLNAVSPRERVGKPPESEIHLRYYTDGNRPAPWYWRSPHWPYARQPIQLILDEGYVDCYWKLHPWDPGYTLWTDYPWIRIDYIFASPTLAALLSASEVATGDWAPKASHHFPVWAEFR